jgi:hypothetical protein
VPRYEGAWPPFAPNLWYANFSWPGVIIGGLLTGLILAAITLRYRHAYTDPFALAFMTHFTILFTFGGGVDNLIFMKFVKGVLPLFIFKALSQKSLVPRDFTKKS